MEKSLETTATNRNKINNNYNHSLMAFVHFSLLALTNNIFAWLFGIHSIVGGRYITFSF